MITRLLYYKNLFILLVISYLLSGCHEDPKLPTTLIPEGYLVAEVSYIDTTSRVTYSYQYDLFGNQVKANYTSATGNKEDQVYEFDADQYILKKSVGGVTLTYEYEGDPKRIKQITGGSLSYTYIYDGTALKTYSIKNGSTTTQYEYGSDGRLNDQDLTLSNGDKVNIKSGKIAKRTATNGIVTDYTYDAQGQLTKEVITSSAANTRTEKIYTYDDKLFYTNATLRARGFPGALPDGQPGFEYDYVGGPVQINNYQTISIKTFKNATNELLTTKLLTYRHQYNEKNYSLGYARSDGARARFIYVTYNAK